MLALIVDILYRLIKMVVVLLLPKSLVEDLCWMSQFIRALIWIKWQERKDVNMVDILEQTVDSQPEKEALIFVNEKEEARYTWRQIDERSNQVAQWLLTRGVKEGTVVGLVMTNSPEFIFTWFGLAKVGAVVAFVNTYIKREGLIHCFKVAKAEMFILDEHTESSVIEAFGGEWSYETFTWSAEPKHEKLKSIADEVASMKTDRVSKACRQNTGLYSTMAYIYTSGTTGYPKASVIKHLRFIGGGKIFALFNRVTASDKTYVTLPLYHASAAIIGCGMWLVQGNTVVLRPKLSTHAFWKDCAQFGCTVILYIGEMCRYLLNTPVSEYEKQHQVRVAIGNGLRKDIWETFQTRFGLPRIGEFYASTEGNASLTTYNDRPGAIGYIPRIGKSIYPVKVIRYDVENDVEIRDKNGRCVLCAPNEPGLLVGMISAATVATHYHGYTDSSATQKKVISNLFKDGDSAFVSGDMVSIDEEGYVYFVDRIGDSFRYKGENVSTCQVQDVISQFESVVEVMVFGVPIPDVDGKPGMAVIVARDQSTFPVAELLQHMQNHLAEYQIPVYLRLTKEIPKTATHKIQKGQIMRLGIKPNGTDVVYRRTSFCSGYEICH